jgi:nucleotidyltransferase/DNA polymerase involved in DNA repair
LIITGEKVLKFMQCSKRLYLGLRLVRSTLYQLASLVTRLVISERASIDEAFIDFTRLVREKIFERYSHLSNVPPDATDGLDSPLPAPPQISWDELGNLVPLSSQSSEGLVDPGDSQGCGEDHDTASWHDVALSIAADMMSEARTKIHTKLGYSTSAVRPPTSHVFKCANQN